VQLLETLKREAKKRVEAVAIPVMIGQVEPVA
jgi:hypothetical protein